MVFIGDKSMEDKSIRDRIVIMLMTRKYNKQGITLPDKFWNLPKYKKDFVIYSTAASRFIRAYGAEVVLNVLNRESWCWSFMPKALPDLMVAEAAKLKREAEKAKNAPMPESNIALPANAALFRKKVNENGEEERET